MFVYNNTFYNDANTGNGNVYFVDGDNCTFKNNILFQERDATNGLRILDPAITSDYNQFEYAGTNIVHNDGNDYTSVANWTSASSQDVNSGEGDPTFVNKASDWSLQSGSPAENTGTDVGLTQDILGNPINGTPDMGCYERQ